MNFSQGHSRTKVQCESCLFSQGKTPEFTKISEIHELFVLGLSVVWFAGATPDCYKDQTRVKENEITQGTNSIESLTASIEWSSQLGWCIVSAASTEGDPSRREFKGQQNRGNGTESL